MPQFKKKPTAKGTKSVVYPVTGDGEDAQAPLPDAPSTSKPGLVPMLALPGQPPESRLGERILYARIKLALSVEALSRYTKNFDLPEKIGIPATTLLRYEKGDTSPAARELRILCTALNVPPRWMLLGELDNVGSDEAEQKVLDALGQYVRTKANEVRVEHRSLRDFFDPFSDQNRVRWLQEARKPAKEG